MMRRMTEIAPTMKKVSPRKEGKLHMKEEMDLLIRRQRPKLVTMKAKQRWIGLRRTQQETTITQRIPAWMKIYSG